MDYLGRFVLICASPTRQHQEKADQRFVMLHDEKDSLNFQMAVGRRRVIPSFCRRPHYRNRYLVAAIEYQSWHWWRRGVHIQPMYFFGEGTKVSIHAFHDLREARNRVVSFKG